MWPRRCTLASSTWRATAARSCSVYSSILATLTKIWQIEHVDDGLELDHDSMAAEVIRDRSVCVGLRVKCRVHLGSAVIPLQIDVGFGDAVYPVVLAIGRGVPFDRRWPPRGPWQAKRGS